MTKEGKGAPKLAPGEKTKRWLEQNKNNNNKTQQKRMIYY